MSYKLWVKEEAKTEISQLPGHIRQRVRSVIRKLRDEPRPHNSTLLESPVEINLEVRRLRLESWRVIYVVDDEWKEIGMLAVRKRPPYDYADLPELLAGLN